jgi:hypothetical protein
MASERDKVSKVGEGRISHATREPLPVGLVEVEANWELVSEIAVESTGVEGSSSNIKYFAAKDSKSSSNVSS